MRIALTAAALALVALAIGLYIATRRDPVHVAPPPAPPVPHPRPPSVPQPLPVSPDASIPIDAPALTEPQHVLDDLRRSGSDQEHWVDQGLSLLRSIPESHDPACYLAGCGATLIFTSEAMYRKRRAELEATDAYRAWTGGKRFVVETRPDGLVTVALVLYRPD